MSISITVSNEVAEHLDRLEVGSTDDIDKKVRLLLIAEYRRKLTYYRITDEQLKQKYNMPFEAFEQKQLTKELGYSWDVESDVIAWETAIDGIRTIKRQLGNLVQAEGAGDG